MNCEHALFWAGPTERTVEAPAFALVRAFTLYDLQAFQTLALPCCPVVKLAGRAPAIGKLLPVREQWSLRARTHGVSGR